MNSQDKPLEGNDNLDEILGNSDEIDAVKDKQADIGTAGEESEAETFEFDEPLIEEDLIEAPPESVNKNLDLDLDDLDFRNPPNVEDLKQSKFDLTLEEQSESWASELEVDSLDLDSSEEIAVLADTSTEETSNLDDISLDNLSEAALNLDNSDVVLDNLELEDLGELESFTEQSLEDEDLGGVR